MKHTYKIDTGRLLHTRFLAGFSVRNAMVNALKDELRSQYDDLAKFDSRKRLMERAAICLYVHIGLIPRIDNDIWEENRTLFGQERRLNKFGHWLIEYHNWYHDATEQQLNRLVSDALKKAGLL